MANPQDELEALRAQLASLTARVYRLEERAGAGQQTSAETVPLPPAPVPPKAAPPVTVSRGDLQQKPLTPMPAIPPRRDIGVPSFSQSPTQPRAGSEAD